MKLTQLPHRVLARSGRVKAFVVGQSKIVLVGLTVGATAVTAGAAVAMWVTNGTGSGNAKALSAVSVTVTAATGAADLYPGFTLGDVFFTSANANPYPVTFTAMTAGTVTSSVSACATTVTVVDAVGLSLLVPAGATATAGTIADVVTMASTAPDTCQGATFTIALTLTGSQT